MVEPAPLHSDPGLLPGEGYEIDALMAAAVNASGRYNVDATGKTRTEIPFTDQADGGDMIHPHPPLYGHVIQGDPIEVGPYCVNPFRPTSAIQGPLNERDAFRNPTPDQVCTLVADGGFKEPDWIFWVKAMMFADAARESGRYTHFQYVGLNPFGIGHPEYNNDGHVGGNSMSRALVDSRRQMEGILDVSPFNVNGPGEWGDVYFLLRSLGEQWGRGAMWPILEGMKEGRMRLAGVIPECGCPGTFSDFLLSLKTLRTIGPRTLAKTTVQSWVTHNGLLLPPSEVGRMMGGTTHQSDEYDSQVFDNYVAATAAHAGPTRAFWQAATCPPASLKALARAYPEEMAQVPFVRAEADRDGLLQPGRLRAHAKQRKQLGLPPEEVFALPEGTSHLAQAVRQDHRAEEYRERFRQIFLRVIELSHEMRDAA